MKHLKTLRHMVGQMPYWLRLLLVSSSVMQLYADVRFALNPTDLRFLVPAFIGLVGIRICFGLRWRVLAKRWAAQRRQRTTEGLHSEARFSGRILLLLLLDPNSGQTTARLIERSKAETVRQMTNAPDQSVVRTFLESSGRVHRLVPTDRDLDESDWRTFGVDLVQSAESTVVSWGIIQGRNMLDQNLDLCVQAFIAVQERALADHLDG